MVSPVGIRGHDPEATAGNGLSAQEVSKILMRVVAGSLPVDFPTP